MVDIAFVWLADDVLSEQLTSQGVDFICQYPYRGLGEFKTTSCLVRKTKIHNFILLAPVDTVIQPIDPNSPNSQLLGKSLHSICVMGLWTTPEEKLAISRYLEKLRLRFVGRHHFVVARHSSYGRKMSSFQAVLKDFYCDRFKLFDTIQK